MPWIKRHHASKYGMKCNFISNMHCNNKTCNNTKSDCKLVDFKLESVNSFIQIVKFSLGPYFSDGP